MARYSGGTRSTGAGSTTLPVGSIYGTANREGRLVEVGIFNTTATAVAIKLVRLTTAGTQGSGLVEARYGDVNSVAAGLTLFDTHSGAPTLGDDLGYRAPLGAAIGAGVIWTFGANGILVPAGTANGVGIIVATGTGQILDWYMVWDE
jgi:hypothetical protein